MKNLSLVNKKNIKLLVIILAVTVTVLIITSLIFFINNYQKNLKYNRALNNPEEIINLIIYSQGLSGTIGKRDFILIEKIKDKEGTDIEGNAMRSFTNINDVLETEDWVKTTKRDVTDVILIKTVIDEYFLMEFYKNTAVLTYKNKKAIYKIPDYLTNNLGEYMWQAMDLSNTDITRNIRNLRFSISLLINDNYFETTKFERILNLISIDLWKNLDNMDFIEEPTSIYIMLGTRLFLSFYEDTCIAVVKYNGNTRIFSISYNICQNLISENNSYIESVINSHFEDMMKQESLLLQFSNAKEFTKIGPDENLKTVFKIELWNPIAIPFDFDRDKAEIQIYGKNMQWSFNTDPAIAVLENGDETRYFSIPETTCQQILKYFKLQ